MEEANSFLSMENSSMYNLTISSSDLGGIILPSWIIVLNGTDFGNVEGFTTFSGESLEIFAFL